MGALRVPAYHDWVSLAPYGMLTAGAVALSVCSPRTARHCPWTWLAIPAIAFALVHAPGLSPYGETWQLLRAGLECALLLAAVGATAATRSPRWALAAAIYILPSVASTLLNPLSDAQTTTYRLALTALLLATITTARRPTPEP